MADAEVCDVCQSIRGAEVSDLYALYQAVFRRLTAADEMWGTRVYPDLAAAGTARPYVVYGWAGGGALNAVGRQDAEFVLTVKCVAAELATAMAGAARLSALLDDADRGSAAALDAGSAWVVLHSKQEQAIHLVEMVDGVRVYHAGYRFRFRMEAV